MAFSLIVPPGTTNLATIDPVVLTTGTDPGTWYFYEGTQTITDGTDLSARPEQTSVYIMEAAQVRFGSIFRLGIATEFVVKARGGLLNIMASDTGDDTIAKFVLEGSMEVIDAGGGIWSTVEVSNGTITMSGSTAITNWYGSGGVSTINYSATGITELTCTGNAYTTCRRGIANNGIVTLDGNSRTQFARAQTIAAPDIAITAGTAELRMGGRAYCDWRGLGIDTVLIESDDAIFDWQNMPASATIGVVKGSAKAIDAVGLREGAVNTLKNGGTLTVTSLVRKGTKAVNTSLGASSTPF